MVTEQKYSAKDVTDLVGVYPPTDEQARIIEAPLRGVYRVMAGAGSGKTETMALRVVWLVANGIVSPHEVLGLTFTRKAASELSQRINERIRALPESEESDIFQMPQVSTYNSFASRLFQDYSVYLGIDADQEVAGQAAAWALARRVVVQSTDPALEELDYSVDRLATLTWQFAQAVSEHAVDLAGLDRHADDMAALLELPLGGRFEYASDMASIVGSQQLIPTLARLVGEFTELKRSRGVVEYSDQVRLALDVVNSADDVVDQVRGQYKVVLLDEYQDTSVLQTKLLSSLFADHPVMSVGDPHQAIYGWRGASASNLAQFTDVFAREYPHDTFGLQVSWRNPEAVLRAANLIAQPLRGDVHDVGVLRPRPDAPEGRCDSVFVDTIDEEAAEVAAWFARELADRAEPPSAALLVRSRTHQSKFAEALRRQGIPVHILGIGGLLADPVVADIVCALSIVHRPHANGELVRLLTSGAFRVGVADLYALSEVARHLARFDKESISSEDERVQEMIDLAVGGPSASLADALDYLSRLPGNHERWQRFSAPAQGVLVEAANLVRSYRQVSHEPLLEQVASIERLSGLDIERMANEGRGSSREAREAFIDAVRQYQAFSDDQGASGFLDWLEQAEWRDSLTPRSEPPEPGCVQILTIHGAKGLEWDLVAVVRAVTDELPAKSKEGSSGWLAAGVLPYPFRGDRDFLPRFAWSNAETRKELVDSFKAFKEEVSDYHLREERRLCYVAMTRAREALLLSGSFWAHQQKPRHPSIFLTELDDAGAIGPLPSASSLEEPPETEPDVIRWPADPLGSRRASVEAAAARVREAIDGSEAPRGDLTSRIEQILAEEEQARQPHQPEWPVRIPASQFDRWLLEPEQMLQSRVQPRPATIGVAQQRGTVFHEWVEGFFAQSASDGLLAADVDPDSPDSPDFDVDMEQWRAAFEASDFARLTPVALEREIHLPLGGHLIICKIDAVFEREGRILIVDWKTGREPRDADEERRKALQLALYRLAWAEWTGSDHREVDAAFWFSATNHTLQPDSLPDRAELETLLAQAKTRSS